MSQTWEKNRITFQGVHYYRNEHLPSLQELHPPRLNLSPTQTADKWQTSIGNTDKCATHMCGDPRSVFHTRKGTANTQCIIQAKRIINIFLQIVGRKRSPVGSYPDGASSYGFTPNGLFQLYLKIQPIKTGFLSHHKPFSILLWFLHPTLILGDVSEFNILQRSERNKRSSLVFIRYVQGAVKDRADFWRLKEI